MKQVTYEGKLIDVEDWARFIARDEDGKIWQYDEMPTRKNDEWRSNSGRFWAVDLGLPNWEDSVMEIKE
jgi:hypothetical protein